MDEAKMLTSHNVESGEWIDVPQGMMVAPGTYVDSAGTLRSCVDDSCVVWHNKGCERKGIHPDEIVYDPATNAPWCDLCWRANHPFVKSQRAGIEKNRADRRRK
jgi:hypothetical protein